MATYSFLDVNAAIAGPGGGFPLTPGSAEEGITIDPTAPINDMKIGADGSVMHSLRANRSGRFTLRLLKTSPINALLGLMYDLQTSSSALHGRNTIVLANLVTGENVTMSQVAFAKAPTLVYAQDGNVNDWEFDAGSIFRILSAEL